MDPSLETAVTTSLWSHLLTVGGFLLAIFALARLLSERRQPSNVLAWLLGIVLFPYIGVPLYLMFGGRKTTRIAARKVHVLLGRSDLPPLSQVVRHHPVAHTIVTNGAGPAASGNLVRLITDGQQAFHELAKGIREARYSVHITTFILGRDETGRALVQLLAERAAAGVKVRLLLDALGCFFVPRSFLKPLIDAGGEVTRFMPMLPLMPRSSAHLRNHRKIAVFDQHTAIIGGHNLAREYMGARAWPRRWTDLAAVITGPAAALLNQVFVADWCFASGQDERTFTAETNPEAVRTEGTSELHVVASGPDVDGDPLYEGIIAMVQAAKRSIWVVTPYFIPDEVLLRMLVVQARAGRDVTLIIPAKSNHPVTDAARRPYLRDLVAAGARVLLHRPGMLHAKAIIVDDTMGLIGSANFDMRSLFVNFEIGVVLYSEADVNHLRSWAGELVRGCEVMESIRLKRRGGLGNLAEDLSRLLAPLL